MRYIKLTKGYRTQVTDSDYEELSKLKWHASENRRAVYAARKETLPNGLRKTVYMHQFILPGVPGVDHKDGNGLNNQRHNLRPSNHSLNAQSFRRKYIGCSSKYRGVSWCKREEKWISQIKVRGHTCGFGYFSDEISAARAYDAAAREHFGEFAHLNFP